MWVTGHSPGHKVMLAGRLLPAVLKTPKEVGVHSVFCISCLGFVT